MGRIQDLERAVGGLSKPSKMPGLSYGIPAAECKVGAILRKRRNTVCGTCYAFKGMYVFRNVRTAQYRRLEILSADLDTWAENMTALLRLKYRAKRGPDRVFRWHDSGDLQSLEHLSAIVRIANNLPDIRFWIPTREYATVREWARRFGAFPSNLTVRVSAPMIGAAAVAIPGTVSSTVSSGIGHACPAQSQGNACVDCRACWDKSVESVDYHVH